jgi:hypothetical protein
MFCNACGKELLIGQQFCGACGQPVGVGTIPRSINRVSHHIQILGILWVVYSLLDLMQAVVVIAVPGVILGILSHVEGANPDLHLQQFLLPLFVTIGIVLLVKSLCGIAAGAGLLQRQPWARILAIVLGILILLSLPFGTALGIYTLWTLFSPDSQKEYESLARR